MTSHYFHWHGMTKKSLIVNLIAPNMQKGLGMQSMSQSDMDIALNITSREDDSEPESDPASEDTETSETP
jgi:hypothetical protein